MGGMRPGFPFPGVMGQQPSAHCNPNRIRATPHALAGSKCRGLIPTACRLFCPCQCFASQHTPQHNLHTLRPSPARPLLLRSRAHRRRYRDASAAIQNQASMMRPSMPGSRTATATHLFRLSFPLLTPSTSGFPSMFPPGSNMASMPQGFQPGLHNLMGNPNMSVTRSYQARPVADCFLAHFLYSG